jgi:hypothetical protein
MSKMSLRVRLMHQTGSRRPSYWGYIGLVFLSLCIIAMHYSLRAEAQESGVEILKRELKIPIVLRAGQFSLSGETYVVAVLKESFLPEPRVRIFLVVGNSLVEVYETTGGGENLTDLLFVDLTGDKLPEVVTFWMCGQRGLRCIKVIRWEPNTRRFEEVFDGQASEIQFGPGEEGKPVEIYLYDGYGRGKVKVEKEKTVFLWEQGKFIQKK